MSSCVAVVSLVVFAMSVLHAVVSVAVVVAAYRLMKGAKSREFDRWQQLVRVVEMSAAVTEEASSEMRNAALLRQVK